MEPGDKKKPSKKIPTGEKQSDARPGVRAAPDATVPVDSLHPAHSDLAVDLREALLCGLIVQVQEFNAPVSVKRPHARNAGTAEAAGTVVENGKLGHIVSLQRASHVCLILNLARRAQEGALP